MFSLMYLWNILRFMDPGMSRLMIMIVLIFKSFSVQNILLHYFWDVFHLILFQMSFL